MSLPAGYVGLLPLLQEAARECGYSLGLHGSLNRDMDIIAMPWIEEAVEPEVLIQRMHDKITFLRVDVMLDNYTETLERPDLPDGQKWKGRIQGPGAPRPHGRLSWNIHLGGGCKIDVSVMPLNRSHSSNYWVTFLNKLSELIPPPESCNHGLLKNTLGSKLVVHLNVGGVFKTVILDDDDLKHSPERLAELVKITSEPKNDEKPTP